MTATTKVVAVLALGAMLSACGGGGSGSSSASSPRPTPLPSANSMPITVNAGPYGNSVNSPFAEISICTPGTSDCQTISGILIDTGSYGLRLFKQVLTISLPNQNDTSGNPIAECVLFGSLTTWGPVEKADIQMGGEAPVSNVPVQVIDATAYGGAPTDCVNFGEPIAASPAALGFNGILGVGPFRHDCGAGCTTTPAPEFYYSCSLTSSPPVCTAIAQPLDQQVQNPVWLLSEDNNGVLIDLPSVPNKGAATVSGDLIFGIGTQSDNRLGSATVYTADSTTGCFTTAYNGASYPSSFIDSGSNGLFFPDSSIHQCGPSSSAPGFYCPATRLALSATNTGLNNNSGTVDFSIANASNLVAGGNTAFKNLGGPYGGGFDWGLPFFFGRRVFTAINQQDTPAGPGPYWAY